VKGRLIVPGLGNIGSALVPHLARLPSVDEVALIDFDRYESANQFGQAIRPRDVSRFKVDVQRSRLQEINPALRVESHAERLENVPLGAFRGSAIIAGLDTHLARMQVNENAWRLDGPWIDAAVDATGWLVRVNVYLPGSPDAPCYECGFSDEDYAAVEQVFPCQGGIAVSAPTNAPSTLGAVAAAVQAIECQKLLTGDEDRLLAGRQVLIDLRHHKHYVTRFHRNAACRFDHQSWPISRLSAAPGQITLDDLALRVAGSGPKQVRLPGHSFVRKAVCRVCLETREVCQVSRRWLPRHSVCLKCGGEMEPVGFERQEWLDVESLGRRDRRRTLHHLGLLPRDVLAVRCGELVDYFELGGRL
jgi:adenylyltransferase/sulfurtransferase